MTPAKPRINPERADRDPAQPQLQCPPPRRQEQQRAELDHSVPWLADGTQARSFGHGLLLNPEFEAREPQKRYNPQLQHLTP